MSLNLTSIKALDHPLKSLTAAFVIWKVTLCLVVALSPGPGYDTSGQLALDLLGTSQDECWRSSTAAPFLQRLVRWDAIYFTSSAARGYVYEQEWAFGWGHSRLIALVAKLTPLTRLGVLGYPAAAFVVSFGAHWLSVLCLFHIALLVSTTQDTRPAFACCLLHIVAPAGAFLVAPYGESLFSFLSFLGMLLYVQCMRLRNSRLDQRHLWQDAGLLSSGLLFGLAATVRSNAILAGTMFAYDACLALPSSLSMIRSVQGARYLASLFTGGALIAVGFAVPQIVAFMEYCVHPGSVVETRPWCYKVPPSIFSFVQEHYWGNGFFTYWTLSNVPLFIIALPMIIVLVSSAHWAMRRDNSQRPMGSAGKASKIPDSTANERLLRLATPQAVLAFLAPTYMHVQIINRLASGYPLLYIWLANKILTREKLSLFNMSVDVYQCTVRWMVMYALIQGGLFASFLPPA